MSDNRKIFNLALAEYGDESVTNPDTDDTVASGRLRDVYEQVFDSVLEQHPWNDAVRRKQIAAEATAPDFGYSTSYLQSTAPYSLRVLSVNNQPSLWFSQRSNFPGRGPHVPPTQPDWIVEGRKILTDFGSPINVVFIARVSEGDLRESVASVIALNLAAATAFKATQSQKTADMIRLKADRAIAIAKNIDAQEGGMVNPFRSDFLQARRS